MTIKELKALMFIYDENMEVKLMAGNSDEPPVSVTNVEYQCTSEKEFLIIF